MKVVIAERKTGKCYQTEIDELKSKPFNGMRLGQEFDGALVGLTGYKMKLTGGSDKQGFPMRADIQSTERKKLVIGSGTGVRDTLKGRKVRKTVRGNTVSEQIEQI
ncbi:MAG: S6e family ribosomal protein, partial [Candidatus Micrarchaeota archaeon]